MKRNLVEMVLSVTFGTAMALFILAGCGSADAAFVGIGGDETATEDTVAVTDSEEDTKEVIAVSSTELEAPYFERGVYVNYAEEAEDPDLTYFYVFDDEGAGYTADGEHEGIGLPFCCEQEGGIVKFSFGGMDAMGEEIFTVDAVENGAVKGHYDDGLELVFVPQADVDPESFDAENYVGKAIDNDYVYNDANGWSVKYDPASFEVNGGGPVTTFIYTGVSAGTNMITATYSVEKNAKETAEDLAKTWGADATVSEGNFPGTDDVTGYWVTLPITEEGSGLYMTAIVRDYMGGTLMFECTEHKSGNEFLDMEVSDALASIIDSINFTA
ncbi:hypothetical protein SAMN04487770_12731 [Butyrivibrio sp. ob235]|uniref:hypothetical protein n=1 Tax=Butyrivibrio sp. ob235 TaxID=1761780 RepID=UPI0008BCFD44|nr:hypothetical protein [Butyrivibrio sp. ob235]SEM15459.1 hypothetical protein SAMN04487770_12731 [Butyrivibrio sp. ob235]